MCLKRPIESVGIIIKFEYFRFDFDNPEDYAKYKGQQEAMPKAAYQVLVSIHYDNATTSTFSYYFCCSCSRSCYPSLQYGMKVSDGRKTKGKIGAKNEKAKLDKEWNKVIKMVCFCSMV